MAKKVLSWDLETCTHKLNKRTASPWHSKNYIVAAGYKYNDEPTFGTYYDSPQPVEFPDLTDVGVIVTFNGKFDLLYQWHRPELQAYFKAGGTLWDCQYVEYLLEGMQQHAQMISMNETIPKYGGTLKLDAVKELWESGINTPEIPEDILMKYLLGDEEEELQGDVNNTYLIFRGQLKRLLADYPPETLTMIKNRMDGLLATTEMEYNGLKIDVELGDILQAEQKIVLTKYSEDLEQFIPKLPPELEFNWNSNYHKSYLIFGGLAKYSKWVHHEDDNGNLQYAQKTEKHYMVAGLPVGNAVLDDITYDRFKGGKKAGEYRTKNIQVPDFTKPKGAKCDFSFRFKGFTTPKPEWKSKLTDAEDKQIYGTGADIIEELSVTQSIPFLKLLQKRNKLKKDLGTYYWDINKKGERSGMLTLVGEDGIMHQKINHTSTKTSRLSASDPNSQNIPKKDKSKVKQLFISRFPKGVLAELDYSQLEVVIMGILCRDPQLIKDLQNRIDFHCKRLSIKLKENYESVVANVKIEKVHHTDKSTNLLGEVVTVEVTYKDMRGDIKSFTFEFNYGAGARTIAANNDIPLEEVEELIRIEHEMYPGIIAFDKMVEDSIKVNRKLTTRELYVLGERHNVGISHWFSPTGTKYVWTEYEAPKFLQDRGQALGFKPTERKNYPSQGTGGEVVQTMGGIVWRWLIANDRFDNGVLMTNTVHDCYWFDIRDQELANKVLPTVKVILEAVPEKFNRDFNLHINVPFPVDVEVGENMYNLTHHETKS